MDAAGASRIDGEMLTLSHLIESFHAHQQIRVKLGQCAASTADWYKWQLAKLKPMGGFPAAELRAHHLVTVEFTNAFVRSLKALYRWASDDGVSLVPKDPFRKLKTPRCGQRTRVLSPPEVLRLYRCSTRVFREFLFIALHTLARPGELRYLLWREVDLANRVFRLSRFKSKDRRKDGMAIRAIPLDEAVCRRLAKLRLSRRPAPADHVFLNHRGGPWTGNAIRCRMRTAREKAGLNDGGENIVCYSCRHTGATDATRKGIQDSVLAAIIGHTSPAMTRRYQHLAASDLVAAVDRLRGQTPAGPKASARILPGTSFG